MEVVNEIVCASSKEEKRKQRKLKGLVSQVQKDVEIEISQLPTNHVMIANVGAVTGAKFEDIVNIFSAFGVVKAVTLVPEKKFSFVSFENEKQSTIAFEAIHGKKLKDFKHPWFLTFVTKIPLLMDCSDRTSDELPPGLILILDFITKDKEEELKQLIHWNNDEESTLKHRQVKHFGYKFCYDSNNVDFTKPLEEKIPKIISDIMKDLLESKRIHHAPDQMTVNRYLPGQGIPLHIDTHSAFEDEILSLSIGSPVIMNFKHFDGRQLNVLLPARSLLIMTDESRYSWKHGISPRKTDLITSQIGSCVSTISHRDVRISFTLRKVKDGPCNCRFKQLCNSQNGISSAPKRSSEVKFEEPVNFENSHVHQVYDQIADHFSSTRYKPWPKIATFLESLPVGSLMLDIGCGNGKYLGLNSNIFKIGCDRSTKLMTICGERKFQGFCSDALILPVRSDSFDVCLCIAVIHHLSTFERRLQVIEDIIRVLRSHGRALIYVWAMDQTANGEDSNYIRNRKVNITSEQEIQNITGDENKQLPVHTNRSNFQHQDLFVPWKMKSGDTQENVEGEQQATTFYRYYHVFEKGELESLCEQVKSSKLLNSYYDKGNWCVVIEKVSTPTQ